MLDETTNTIHLFWRKCSTNITIVIIYESWILSDRISVPLIPCCLKVRLTHLQLYTWTPLAFEFETQDKLLFMSHLLFYDWLIQRLLPIGPNQLTISLCKFSSHPQEELMAPWPGVPIVFNAPSHNWIQFTKVSLRIYWMPGMVLGATRVQKFLFYSEEEGNK